MKIGTPHQELKQLGACDLWVKNAEGKTWEQLYAFAQAATPGYDHNTGEANGNLFWKWLMWVLSHGLETEWYYNQFYDIAGEFLGQLMSGRSDISLRTNEYLGLLPLSAWKEAVLAQKRYYKSKLA